MADGLPGARRPRPVADVPPPSLADGTAPAKAWLVALVAAAPLEAVPSLPAAELAARAPALCAAVLRAVGSDRELARLAPGGDTAGLAAEAGRLAGAAAPAGVAAAVAQLRDAMWDVLSAELDPRAPELAAAGALRLAHVCDLVLQAALSANAGGAASGAAVAVASATPAAVAPASAPTAGGPPAFPPWWAAGTGGDAATRDAWPPVPGATPAGRPAAPGGAPAEAPGARPAAPGGAPPGAAPWGVPARAGQVAEPFSEPGPDVVATRSAPGADEPWIAAVERRLAAGGTDPEPFALLALEADGVDRLLVADTDGSAARALADAEAAIAASAPPAAEVVREHPGRVWIVAPGADPAAARALGEQLAAAATTVAHRGAPLAFSVGLATCPDDGTDAATLVAHADEGVFAARAAGVRLA